MSHSSELAALIAKHEAYGITVGFEAKGGRDVIYVDAVIDGERHGAPGLFLSTDPDVRNAQAIDYLTTTFDAMVAAMAKGQKR